MDLIGEGGSVALRVPWEEVTVKVDGKDARIERKGDLISFDVPAGAHHVEVSG